MVKYFDLYESGYRTWVFLKPCGVLIGILLLFIIITSILEKKFNLHLRSLALKFITIGVIILTLVGLVITYKEFLTFKIVLSEKKFKIIEGYIEHFDPMPYEGHATESFIINGIKFEYSDFDNSNAFNNTKSHGGPIDEGKYVRIYYYNNKILKLLIKK